MTQPLGRQIAQNAYVGWYVLLWAVLFGCVLTYVGFMITSSAKGFQLRDAQNRVERLQTETRALETQVAEMSSIQQMTDRAMAMGFVAADHVESVNAAGNAYAMAR
jgi:cell division protein FtsL